MDRCYQRIQSRRLLGVALLTEYPIGTDHAVAPLAAAGSEAGIKPAPERHSPSSSRSAAASSSASTLTPSFCSSLR